MSAQSYPLQWPDHIPRSSAREKSRFRSSYEAARTNVVKSLKAFAHDSGRKVTDAILSSNVDLLSTRPADPGVAVWFNWDGLSVSIPCDRYQTPAENLQAVHHIIEARRVELRHGTLHLVRASFRGFVALPPPAGAARVRPWWEVLGFRRPGDAGDAAAVHRAFREKARTAHPDAGGSNEAMAELAEARNQALEALR